MKTRTLQKNFLLIDTNRNEKCDSYFRNSLEGKSGNAWPWIVNLNLRFSDSKWFTFHFGKPFG